MKLAPHFIINLMDKTWNGGLVALVICQKFKKKLKASAVTHYL